MPLDMILNAIVKPKVEVTFIYGDSIVLEKTQEIQVIHE